MFGYQGPEQLVGVPIFDLLDPDEHPRITANVQARARGEAAPSVFAVRARRRDGAPFLIDVHAAAYPEGDGWTTVVVMRDVTAQREAEARVADSERRYRELFDQVPVGVWEEDLSGVKAIVDGLRARGVTDFHEHFRKHPQDAAACAAAARVLAVNATVCRMAGAIDSAQLLANLERVIPPESLPSFVAAVADMAQGKPVTTSEGWNNTLDGRRVWVSMRAALASGREHDWSRLVVTTTDMTERLQAREEREALQDRLRHSEKLEAIGRLAGGVAHDFNNLLAAIMAHTELALIEAPPGASSMVDSLNVIQEASLRARDLVRQILTFGRKDRPRPEPLDLEKVVTDALVLARTAVPATVALSTRVHRAGVVLADRTQLHQIVLNLCANARDAVAGNGHIDVELDQVTVGAEVPELKGRSCARLRVRDDGIGMDEATRARLFEPYMTTRAHVGGHGLGLAVVHGIVTSAGGAIAVDSAPGAGSTFDVYLPNVEELPPVAVNPRRASGGHERILLVDDEPLVLSAHRRLLSSLGYAVTVAYDAEQALKQLRASPGAFDLVISDQSMPRMSGFELARALLSEQPRARVMLVTGFSDEVDDARAREHGLKGVLLKPLSREVFDAAIRAALA
jgi:PAS domain S-box-containing protein